MLLQEGAEEVQAQLLRRIAAGDLQAMSAFYDQTAKALFSLAARILADSGEAEEVIQDVFMQIWDKAGVFDPLLGSAFHWALSIARHRSIDRLRGRQRRARLMEELNNMGLANASIEEGANADALGADEVAGIRSALNDLPDEQRLAIEMAFFAGKTHPEIAEALHEPLGTIKARIRRGMLKLRHSLQAHA